MLVTVAAGLLGCADFSHGFDIRWILTLTTARTVMAPRNLQVIIDVAPRTLYFYLIMTISFTTPRTLSRLAPSLILTLEPGRPVEASYPAFFMLRAMDSVHHCLDSISSTIYSTHKGDDGA